MSKAPRDNRIGDVDWKKLLLGVNITVRDKLEELLVELMEDEVFCWLSLIFDLKIPLSRRKMRPDRLRPYATAWLRLWS